MASVHVVENSLTKSLRIGADLLGLRGYQFRPSQAKHR